jgi:hypothetical protein
VASVMRSDYCCILVALLHNDNKSGTGVLHYINA